MLEIRRVMFKTKRKLFADMHERIYGIVSCLPRLGIPAISVDFTTIFAIPKLQLYVLLWR